MAEVIFILGSNLGNRLTNLERAIYFLEKEAGKVLKRTDIYETTPFGVEKQPPFLNTGILMETFHPPQELLYLVKWIERQVGRYPTYRWGPRVIDVDIITYDEVKISTPRLKIPHPGLKDRDFFRKIYFELTGSFPSF
jgi:2-amino-4-hydroxy-6-hydroxymethyldihydropteridine diphosphokinase